VAIRLLLDADVRPLLAVTLRQRGFDARHVDELKRSGLSDPEQLAFAVKQRRAFLTHNIRDFVVLDREYRAKGQGHYGVLLCDQVPFRELLRRTLRCLGRKSEADIRNQLASDEGKVALLGWRHGCRHPEVESPSWTSAGNAESRDARADYLGCPSLLCE
jgi:predicted nuclease of predicted toxin-antitoxin system